MSEVNAGTPAGGSETIHYADIVITEKDRQNATMTIDGVPQSPIEASATVSMASIATMKKVSFSKISEAEKFLDKLRLARDLKKSITDQSKLAKEGHYGDLIFTKEQADFLNQEVKHSVPYNDGVLRVQWKHVGELTPALLKASGLRADKDGHWIPPADYHWADLEQWVPDTDRDRGRAQTGTTGTGLKVTKTSYGEDEAVWVKGLGSSTSQDNADAIQEDLGNYIDQTSNDNTLHMSKLKNVLSSVNSREEMANSLMNAANEQRNQRISRYSG